MTDKLLRVSAAIGVVSIIVSWLLLTSQVVLDMLSAKSNVLPIAGIGVFGLSTFFAVMLVRFLIDIMINYKSRMVVKENGELREELVGEENKSKNI